MEATFWKLLGLALTSALGVIGTMTDTKEKVGSGYKLRGVGWFVVVGIITASLVAGIAQYHEDWQRTEAEATVNGAMRAQIETMFRITEEMRRVRYRLGDLAVTSFVVVEANDPTLRRIRASHPSFLIAQHKGARMTEAQELAAKHELVRGMSAIVLLVLPKNDSDLKDDITLIATRTSALTIKEVCEDTDASCAEVTQQNTGSQNVRVRMTTTAPQFDRATLVSLEDFSGYMVQSVATLGPKEAPARSASLAGVAFLDLTHSRYIPVEKWAKHSVGGNDIYAEVRAPDVIRRHHGNWYSKQ